MVTWGKKEKKRANADFDQTVKARNEKKIKEEARK